MRETLVQRIERLQREQAAMKAYHRRYLDRRAKRGISRHSDGTAPANHNGDIRLVGGNQSGESERGRMRIHLMPEPPRSTIFERDPSGVIVARQDARVRICLGEKDIWRTYGSLRQHVGREAVYEMAELLEFWPDWDYRMKMRGQVWVKTTTKIVAKYGHIAAHNEGWIQLRETELHQEDRENLYIHCARKLDGGPLTIPRIEREETP